MNKKTILATFLVLSSLLTFQAFAADQSGIPDQSAVPGSSPDMSSGSGMQGGAAQDMQQGATSSNFIGKKVISSDGQDIGRISSIVLDPNSHSIAYAIVSYQGRNYPVPFRALSMQSGDQFALNLDRDRFLNAPTLAQGLLPETTTQQFTNRVHQYYGVTPSWEVKPGAAPEQKMDQSGTSDQSAVPENQRDMSSGSAVQGGAATDTQASDLQSTTSSNFIGKRVVSSDGRDIGKITNLVVDPNTHSIAYAIVSYQGKNYPVPFRALSMKSDNEFALNIDRDKFVNAPTLAKGLMPDTSAQFTNQVHQYYGVTPSWEVKPGEAPSTHRPDVGYPPDHGAVNPGSPGTPGSPSENTPGTPGGPPVGPVTPGY